MTLPHVNNNRLNEIDILRGIAIFGILMMNMVIFSLPTKLFDLSTHPWPENINIAANWFVVFFVRDKFYHIFAMLFGISFAIMMERNKLRNGNFKSFFLRRISILLIIGLLHGFLIWSGDVLVIYAVLGFVLFSIKNQSPRNLLIFALAAYSIPIFAPVINKLATLIIGNNQTTSELKDFSAMAKEQANIFSNGSFQQITGRRIKEALHFYTAGLDSFIARALSMMIFGLYLWKQGIVQNIQKYLPILKKYLWWFLIIGFSGQLLRVTADEFTYPHDDTHLILKFLTLFTNTISVPALSLGYAIIIYLLYNSGKVSHILNPISAVGRMAITNYLFHSLLCTTLFYGYGFGLYGKIKPANGLLLATGIFIFQIGFSNWWLSRYKFGPVEWLWRSLTYKNIQTMK